MAGMTEVNPQLVAGVQRNPEEGFDRQNAVLKKEKSRSRCVGVS